MQRSVAVNLTTSIVPFRWIAWAWMTVLALLSKDSMSRGWLAVLVVLLTFGFSATAHRAARLHSDRIVELPMIATEIAFAAFVTLAGAWVYPTSTGAQRSDSLGWAWPVASILAAGVAFGPKCGGAVGLLLSAARIAAAIINGTPGDDLVGASTASSTLLFVLAGVIAGLVTDKLQTADRQLADAQARESVARTLHDGVLQTLAVFERRSEDPDLARMARATERDLREYLFGVGSTAELGGAVELGPALREAAAKIEDRFGCAVRVVLAPDLPTPHPSVIAALTGAAAEAMNNAGKHSHSTSITVYCEPIEEEGISCSIRDNGTGFDPSSTVEGVGLTSSVRGRLSEVGGTVQIESAPGRGTEILLTIPYSSGGSV
ncbi:MAG TPA: hypothetical protein DEG43_00325 [Acidimicrobiaceae bacterium]|nr:hypothetical protein [Acidimicrobiaceae bacterium]